MNKAILYWVDDDSTFYNAMTMACPPEVKFDPYFGGGSLKDFLDALPDIRKNYQNPDQAVYFLLDIQMPVPSKLVSARVWGNHAIHREQVCGIALAHYLHLEIGLKAEHICLLSSTANFSANELPTFDRPDFKLTIENNLWGKSDVTTTKLRNWMKDALKGA